MIRKSQAKCRHSDLVEELREIKVRSGLGVPMRKYDDSGLLFFVGKIGRVRRVVFDRRRCDCALPRDDFEFSPLYGLFEIGGAEQLITGRPVTPAVQVLAPDEIKKAAARA